MKNSIIKEKVEEENNEKRNLIKLISKIKII